MTAIQLAQILTDIADKKDPVTGSSFSSDLLSDVSVLEALIKLTTTAQDVYQHRLSVDENWPEDEIYEKLREWRNDEASLREVHPFQVLWNSHLRAIVNARITRKEDLLNVTGIGPYKYNEYGDSIYEILEPYIKNRRQQNTEESTESSKTETFEEPVAASDSLIVESCKNCALEYSGDCFGSKGNIICDYYVYRPTITPDEAARNREILGGATVIRLTGHGHNDGFTIDGRL